MSGHSKWHSIKHKKGAADAARGKVFTKHAKLIEVAARAGGDPEMNPSLRVAIDNAKSDNVPNANIERAIKKGTGELKDGKIIEEITYEGYGPNGIALLVNCLTDNKNRTVSNIKSIFGKNGGSMGENGSVSWMFKRKGVINIENTGNTEEIELSAIDAGAEDIDISDSVITVICDADEFLSVKDKLSNYKILQAKTTHIPDSYIKITDETIARKILKLVLKFEDDDDCENVCGNFDIDDEILDKISGE